MVRRLKLDGSQLEGIHYLRALDNAESLRRDAEQAEHVVCVGGSYIGCEVAATLTALGRRCTVVMLEAEPLERGVRRARRALVPRAAGVPRRRGRRGRGRAASRARRARRGRAARRRPLAARRSRRHRRRRAARRDARPQVGPRDRRPGGVRCDASCVTSAEGVYAAGDMCEYDLAAARRARAHRARGPRRARARRPRATCSARPRSTARCPTSSPTSPTGRRSSTSAAGRVGRGARRGARWRTALLRLVPRGGRVRGVLRRQRPRRLARGREALSARSKAASSTPALELGGSPRARPGPGRW